jgi:hypothetical protein
VEILRDGLQKSAVCIDANRRFAKKQPKRSDGNNPPAIEDACARGTQFNQFVSLKAICRPLLCEESSTPVLFNAVRKCPSNKKLIGQQMTYGLEAFVADGKDWAQS